MLKHLLAMQGLGAIVVGLGMLTMSVPVFANVDPVADPVHKLGRGVANTATGVLELPFSISTVNAQNGPVAAVSWGVLHGVGSAIARTSVGILEVLTFPFPLIGVGYEPIMQPEFLLEPEPTPWAPEVQ